MITLKLRLMNRFRCIPALAFYICLTLFVAGCSKKETVSALNHETASSTEPKVSVESKRGIVADKSPADITYTPIEWTDLLPDNDLEALENPPEYLADIEDGSEDDQLTSQLKVQASTDTNAGGNGSAAEDRYQQALASKNIRPEFNGRHVRIPGFIVPLEFDDHQTITTFFLVPFFGACIHMPPPPPNQIIYAEYEPGIKLDALYDPFWINGTLSTTLVENDLATAAYSLAVVGIEPYTEFVPQGGDQEIEQDPSM